MKMLLGGRPTDAESGRHFPVRNPATGEVIDTVPQAGPEDVREAIRIARIGRPLMAGLPAHRRSAILKQTADLIAEHFDELVQLLTRENGKTIRQCRAEMTTTERLFVDFAEEAKRIKGEVLPMDAVPGLEHMLAYTVRQPVGIVVGIIPVQLPRRALRAQDPWRDRRRRERDREAAGTLPPHRVADRGVDVRGWPARRRHADADRVPC